jgi:hypothetical protein
LEQWRIEKYAYGTVEECVWTVDDDVDAGMLIIHCAVTMRMEGAVQMLEMRV